ncbi:3-isopropylmalate dehydratase small subunit [Campylobacter curvus]|uniref:3-isopropylmalate dehydratase small subunit n=1 Tax=Campylobacter curvus TaxID=200 RepID=UPI00223481F6|nr:3-isopropylmalate dehydratase small subunit [Campylobacter curvus]
MFCYNRSNLNLRSKMTGKVWKFGDNIDTDIIIAARYLNTSDENELAKHIMEDADPKFSSKIAKGDIIVAGENFGCGSSREHAPLALKAAGIGAVVAKSYARIFYRNSFNTGLLILEVPQTDELNEGDELKIDVDNGTIVNLSTQKEYKFNPIPPFMQELLKSGGLIEYAKAKVK